MDWIGGKEAPRSVAGLNLSLPMRVASNLSTILVVPRRAELAKGNLAEEMAALTTSKGFSEESNLFNS